MKTMLNTDLLVQHDSALSVIRADNDRNRAKTSTDKNSYRATKVTWSYSFKIPLLWSQDEWNHFPARDCECVIEQTFERTEPKTSINAGNEDGRVMKGKSHSRAYNTPTNNHQGGVVVFLLLQHEGKGRFIEGVSTQTKSWQTLAWQKPRGVIWSPVALCESD